MTYLLDTDHFSVLQRRSSAEYAQLRLRMSRYSLSDFAVSIVSFHEQALGCHEYIKRARVRQNLLRGYEMLARVLTDYRSLTVLHFSAAEAATFDQLRSAGVRFGTMDLRIGVYALCNGLTLLTRNARDFGRIPGLNIEDWTTP